MPSSSRRLRLAFALLLTLTVLVSPCAWARGGPASGEQPAKVSKPSPTNLLSRSWSFITTFWSKEGCHIDPDGRCVLAPAPVPTGRMQRETGCHIDPNGLCHF